LQLVGELLGFSHCALLLLEAGTEAGAIREPEGKVIVRPWKPLPSNGSEDVTVDTSMCVMLNCKV
jgi:hypothetical protein